MSSKVSKSEKAKLKFAQSNINHVYKGNTSETQHKPTVRQYGMQVVGKLQGTRRLPPPAWVPSIKAETGGLDSRVTLVPPGGSGWGAPSSGESLPAQVGESTIAELGSSSVAASIPTVNGSLTREAIETSFEPAYARSSLGLTTIPTTTVVETADDDPLGTRTSTNGNETDKLNDQPGLMTKQMGIENDDSNDASSSKCTTWASRTQSTVASGGLAANKPFFQRPTPVTSSSTSVETRQEHRNLSHKSTGANEIVCDPSGWAAVSDQEPNFDERILFSDEEEIPECAVSTSNCANLSQSSSLTKESSVVSTHSSVSRSVPAAITQSGRPLLSSNESYECSSSTFSTTPLAPYSDSSNRMSAEIWSAPDAMIGLGSAPTTMLNHCHITQPLDPHYRGSGCILSSSDRILGGQFVSQAPPVHHIPPVYPDQFLSNQLSSSRIVTSMPATLVDSILPVGDVDSELQHAQRQARTQEFKSAVERAQQARAARQKSDAFSTDGGNLLHRSVVSLLSDSLDTKSAPAIHVTAASTSSSTSLPTSQTSVQPLIGNILTPQLLLSSAYQQAASENRHDFAAAVAAATAVAMACNGCVTSASLLPNVPTLSSGLRNAPTLHQTSISPHPVINSNIGNAWNTAFTSSLTSNTGIINTRSPMVPQLIQNTLAMASGGSRSTSGTHSNSVFVNPGHFVERFLEIFNQQQQAPRSSFDQHTLTTKANNQVAPSTDSVLNQNTQSYNEKTMVKKVNSDTPSDKNGDIVVDDVDDLSIKLDAALKPTLSPVVNHLSDLQTQTESTFDPTTSAETPEKAPNKPGNKRVPGLMDVKVPSTSRNFSLLWEQDDYLSHSRGGRGRTRVFVSDKMWGASKNKRLFGRVPNEDIKVMRNKSSTSADAADPRYRSATFGVNADLDREPRSRVWQISNRNSARRSVYGTKTNCGESNSGVTSEGLTSSTLKQDDAVDPNCSRNVPPDSDVFDEADLSDISEEQYAPEKKTKEKRLDDTELSESSRRVFVSVSRQKYTAKSDSADHNEGDTSVQRGGYHRRADRGRGGRGVPGHHPTNSRTFSNDSTYALYYGGTDSKYYHKSSRGGGFTVRGHRGSVQADSRGRRNLDTYDQDTRNYYSVQSNHGPIYHDAENRDRTSSFEARANAYTRDGRRHWTHPKPRSGTQSTAHHSNEFHHETHFSDGEQAEANHKRVHTRVPQSSGAPRNRSHESLRCASKNTVQTCSVNHRQTTTDEGSAESPVTPIKDKPPPFDLCPPPLIDYDDSDIPTVRVPAIDTSFQQRAAYSNSRGGRTGVYIRGNAPRRTNSKTAHIQQQGKRTSGSGFQGSRRYRDLQDRYRDDKDGDGGAAAGGGGHSSTGSTTAAAYGSGGFSGLYNNSDLSGGQNPGGTRESGSVDSFSSGEPTNANGDTLDTTRRPKVHDDISRNNTNSFHDRTRLHRHQAARGNVSDANDVEEWETATEGSTGSGCSNNATFQKSSATLACVAGEVLACSENRTLANADSDGAADVPPDGATDLGDREQITTLSTCTDPRTGDDPVETISSLVSQPSRGVSGCQMPKSDNCFLGQRDSNSGVVMGVDARRGEASVHSGKLRNTSVTGGRSVGYQTFRNMDVSRTYHSQFSYRTQVKNTSIPPLMSIKPHSSFIGNHTDLDSVIGEDCKSSVKNNVTNATPANTDVSQSKTDCIGLSASNSVDEHDAESIPSDGFTKVVSKASKKLARRRQQQELIVTPRQCVRKQYEEQKSASSMQLSDVKPERHMRNINSLNGTKCAENTQPSKMNCRKGKLPYSKPTFMGPPISIATHTSLVSVSAVAVSPAKTAISKDPVTSKHWSCVSTPSANASIVTAAAATTRTWSKVVGTKSVANTFPSATKPEAPVTTGWSVQTTNAVISTTSSPCSAGATPMVSSQSLADNVTLSTSSKPIVCSVYNTVPQFWSATKSGDAEKSEAKTDVVIQPDGAPKTTAPSVSASATSPSASSMSTTQIISTVSNNICKVRPQQQQPLSLTGSVSSVVPEALAAHVVSVNSSGEQIAAAPLCVADVRISGGDRQECEYNTGANRVNPSRLLNSEPLQPASRSLAVSWTDSLISHTPNGYYSGGIGDFQFPNNIDGHLSANLWPTTDQLLDTGGAHLAPSVGVSNVHHQQSYVPPHASDALANIFTCSNRSSNSNDPSHKPSHPVTVLPRSHPSYTVQPYGHSSTPSSNDMQNCVYNSSVSEYGKPSTSQAQHTGFASVASSVYVPPQQQSGRQSQPHSFGASWSMPQSQHSHLSHPQRYRQRLAHQVDPPQFGGFTYQPDMQGDFAYLPTVSGCVQPAPSGGLYSNVQAQSHTTYHPESNRHVLGPVPATNPWSLLGTPTGMSSLQAANPDYNGGFCANPGGNVGGGGLLPHPVAQGGYNSAHCSIPPTMSSSPNPSFVNHPNYVGVIGGGRPNSDLTNGAARHRGMHQNVYPSHNIPHPASAHGQQQFQMPSAFYPSLSPSHQRVHLQHFPASQGRASVHSLINSQNGLYPTAFGALPNQPTPPPLPSHMAYPASFSTESTAAPPIPFHSTAQAHTFSTVGMHLHGHRPSLSSISHVPSRNLNVLTNHGGSPMIIPGAAGPSGMPALTGYAQPAAATPLSVSGYPLKTVLPTL
ncbi:hypothetical protein PHET_01915 [Paragonimus heterotremus]|uniref:BAT2 N-terminal domain-containing protein n=1 Tax=Paragonimus heterotremus TaxID=100268 RepID=A0A8J4TDC3_9TREM|nr:hypothetical protein PHET_01915 [Paragonimus heterotremus]